MFLTKVSHRLAVRVELSSDQAVLTIEIGAVLTCLRVQGTVCVEELSPHYVKIKIKKKLIQLYYGAHVPW